MKKLIIIIFILIISISLVTAKEYTQIEETENFGDVIIIQNEQNPVEFFLASALGELDFLTIALDPVLPSPGDRIKVTWSGAVGCDNGLIEQGVIGVRKKSETNSYLFTKPLQIVNSGGFSGTISMELSQTQNMPEGDYTVNVAYFGKDNELCYQEWKDFTIEEDQECNFFDYCDSYRQVTRIDGGAWMERSCYDYGFECREDVSTEQKVFCDSGYYRDGLRCVEDKPEEEEQEVVIENFCGDGTCSQFEDYTNCPKDCEKEEVVEEKPTEEEEETTEQETVEEEEEKVVVDNKEEIITEDVNVKPWYLQGYNLFFIIGIALVVLFLIFRKK